MSGQTQYRSRAVDPFQHEPFARIPQMFLQGLTPEEYRERLALYQQAYERAWQKVHGPKPFVPPFEFDVEGGLGI